MSDFLSRLVVVLDRHALSSVLKRWVKRLPAEAWLANQMPLRASRISQGKIMEKLPAQMTVIGISKPGGPEVLLPETRAVPAPGPAEILIKGAAAPPTRPPAARAINYKPEDFVTEVRTATDGAGANLILDMVGGDYIERNYDAAATDGRVVQIAFLGGPKANVNFAKLMVKRLHHTGSTLRPRTNTDKAAMVAAIEAKVMPLLREGRIKPLMDSTFPLEKAADAHRRMETSEHIGKIVLVV